MTQQPESQIPSAPSAPPYDVFLKRGPRSRVWEDLVQDLEPGVPRLVAIPDDRTVPAVQSRITGAAARLGVRVRTRTVNGEVWVCLLRPEDSA